MFCLFLMSTALSSALADAKLIFAEIVEVEESIRRDYDRLLSTGWRLGKALCALKAQIGHGKWLFWLGGHMPDIGEDKALRCMQLYAANERANSANGPNPAHLRDFNVDSIRRFLGGYLPSKIRPQLEGDQRLAPVVSFDSGCNKIAALFHRIKEGHAQPPPWEVVAPQARLIITGLIDLYGPDHIAELLH
jgi:hypothetical protein